jgi:hypothetical protein
MAIGTGSQGSRYGSDGYNGALDGWIASIIIYQRVLSDDERFLVERYLGNEYDIPIE